MIIALTIFPLMSEAQAPNPQPSHSQTTFSQTQFIVKFKDGAVTAAEDLLTRGDLSSSASADQDQDAPIQSIKKLNRRFKVKKIRKLYKRSKSNMQALKARKPISKKIQKLREKTAVDTTYVVEIPKGSDIVQAMSEYRQNPNVQYVQPDYLIKADYTPNDPYYPLSLWGLERINMEPAWDISQGEGIIVAVVDTGLDYDHPDLQGQIWTNTDDIPNNGYDDDGNGFEDDVLGWDFTTCTEHNESGECLQVKEPDNDPADGNFHGTHVSGTIAAAGNNNLGIIGVAPSAKIMPVKALDDSGFGYSSELAQAIRYAAENGADIINNSWGCESACPSNPVIEEAVKEVYDAGVILVFSSGNNYSLRVRQVSPQNMKETITVGALDDVDQMAGFTTHGLGIDVVAPGVNILSLNANQGDNVIAKLYPHKIVDTDYFLSNGTSMAAPHVSGLAALILSKNPLLSPEKVRQIIRNSADDLIYDHHYHVGSGIINAGQALLASDALEVQMTKLDLENELLNIDNPREINILGTVKGGLLDHYQLFYATVEEYFYQNPVPWKEITPPQISSVDNGLLGSWKMDETLVDHTRQLILKLSATAKDGRIFDDYKKLMVEVLNKVGLRQLTFPSQEGLTASKADISGTDVCYHANLNGTYEIRHLDLVTMKHETIVSSDSPFRETCAISENGIIWAQDVDEDLQIFLYDIQDKTTQQISSDNKSPYSLPYRISGNKVLWKERWEDNSTHFILYNILTKKKIVLSSGISSNGIKDFDIDENRIVYTVVKLGQPNNHDLYYCDYDPSSQACPKNLIKSSDKNEYQSPRVSGDHIIWYEQEQCFSSGYCPFSGTVRDYSISEQKEKILCDNRDFLVGNTYVGIGNNSAVWDGGPWFFSDYNAISYFDIHLYNLETDALETLPYQLMERSNPAIDNNDNIVYMAYNNIENIPAQIYLYEQTPLPRAPVITSVSPVHLTPKDEATIIGEHFGEFEGNLKYDPNVDSNQDGSIDILDFGLMIECWSTKAGSERYKPEADFNKDSVVDRWDFFMLFAAWQSKLGDQYVTFSPGSKAKIVSWTDTKIVCEVPYRSKVGPVRVTNKYATSNGMAVKIIRK